jgi:ABC-2 type transport system permease protein
VGLFTITLVDLLLIAVLAMTVQVLVNQKFLGYVLSALVVVLFTAGGNVVFENARLLQYGFRPKSYYSDLSGYGSMLEPVRWFQGYWLAIALLLICITALFWVRGADTQPKQRWRIARQRFTRPMQTVMALSAIAALLLGGWIYYNTALLSAGTNRGEGVAQLVAYEQAYGHLRDAQPTITAINLQGDLYPDEDARFAVKGTYSLENQTQQPIDTILIQVFKATQMNQIALAGAPEGQPIQHPSFQGYAFTLPTPLPPGGTVEASFDLVRQPPEGFANDPGRTFTAYVDNGANFGSIGFLPQVGFNDQLRFLISPEMWEQAGLPPIDPEADQARATQINANHPDTHLAQFSAILSTAPDQIIFTSGEQVRDWTEGNRRYFEYQSQVPIEKQVPFISGRYEVQKDDWQGISIEIYYHPGHDRNLDHILAGAKQGLDYAAQQFGPYPPTSLRIVETPYVNEAVSYPGGQIFMGENQVFLANLKDDGTNTLDIAFHITAHAVAHQWWGQQIHISYQRPGDRVLTESLAEYTANQVYAREFGTTGLGAALRNNLNLYLQSRNRSDVPLVEAGVRHYPDVI